MIIKQVARFKKRFFLSTKYAHVSALQRSDKLNYRIHLLSISLCQTTNKQFSFQ